MTDFLTLAELLAIHRLAPAQCRAMTQGQTTEQFIYHCDVFCPQPIKLGG